MNLLTFVPAAWSWAGPATSAPAPALPPGLLPAAALTLWAVLMYHAWHQARHQAWRQVGLRHSLRAWWRSLPGALMCGTAIALAALHLLPPGPPPGLAQWGYALPAATLHAAALGFGLASAGVAWPLLVLRRARRR